MDFVWVLFAFACGLGMKLVSFPPLIGYLLAGFALNFYGVVPNETLNTLANMGITLLLFTIGLKLDVKTLLKPEVWGGALSHMSVWMLLFTGVIVSFSAFSLPYFSSLSLQESALVAFLLSFSSTVCVVKVLEESGELKTRHGKLSIGILVMQDLIAVLFIAFATGKIPSVWALALLGLFFIKPALDLILKKSGHGELLPLAGFVLALGSYEVFELLGIKGDIGALVIGVLLSGSPKAKELSKALMNFKDLFLIGFFLSIGFVALPTWSMAFTALLIALLLPLKFMLFFGLLTRFNMRGRTSYLSALALSNMSEFGLIVAAMAVNSGWLSENWLVITSLAVSLSFIFTSMAYKYSHEFYMLNKNLVKKFEREKNLVDSVNKKAVKAEILVIGLGRVGLGAYKSLAEMAGEKVCGVDADSSRVELFCNEGLNVCLGDGEDADFWEQIKVSKVKLVLLALPSVKDSSNILLQMRSAGFKGKVAAIARYQDEQQKLLDEGVDKVFNFFTEAGVGFAEESMRMVK